MIANQKTWTRHGGGTAGKPGRGRDLSAKRQTKGEGVERGGRSPCHEAGSRLYVARTFYSSTCIFFLFFFSFFLLLLLLASSSASSSCCCCCSTAGFGNRSHGPFSPFPPLHARPRTTTGDTPRKRQIPREKDSAPLTIAGGGRWGLGRGARQRAANSRSKL